jgi:TonB family protein
MTRSKLFSIALTLAFSCVAVPRAFSQATASQPEVVLVKLSPLVYPPLARQAHIAGDVSIRLSIRQDGSVESAEVIGGHPMLAQAALESAQKSQFECRGCNATASYTLTYTFSIDAECRLGPNCENLQRPPRLAELRDHIELTVDPVCTCDPVATITKIKVRSAKCLYLWRCGSRTAESDN